MLCPWNLHRAALLLSLCLQLQGHLHAAAPLPLGENTHSHEVFPKTQAVPSSEVQERSLLASGPDTASQKDSQDDLFQDVDPKALAAVLLQALRLEPAKASESHLGREPSANEEKVRSETKSSDVQPERDQGWKAREEGGQSLEEEGPEQQQEMGTVKSMLQELKRYSPVAKREQHPPDRRAAVSALPGSARGEVLRELEEYEQLRVHTKRKAPPSEPWEGARKLRQQQHLEHQLLQRRYEELAESRRQAEEARRAAAEEERLADMASDLLLQYLLKDGEGSEEEEEEEERQVAQSPEGSEERSRKGTALLFEDEESNVAEDKRSNEAPEEEEEQEEEDNDIDPNTIDRLIELSSKLHLPADDVIDIINDVEKKKKEEEMPAPFSKSKAPVPPSWDKPKKSPSYPIHSPGPKPIQKYPYPPARQPSRHLPKEDEEAWNEVLRGEESPATKWYHAKPNNIISNYINPRTFQLPAAYHHYPHLPRPMAPRDGYYEDRQAHNEDLENYIEKVLWKHTRGF